MQLLRRTAKVGAALAFIAAATGCSSGLGGVLGSVLGGGGQGQGSQLSGTIQSVDTRNQQLTIRQSNGQQIPVLFDIQPAVRVKLRVRDHDGSPATASFVFRDAAGHVHPPQAKRLAPDFYFQSQIYRSDGDIALLPPGRLTGGRSAVRRCHAGRMRSPSVRFEATTTPTRRSATSATGPPTSPNAPVATFAIVAPTTPPAPWPVAGSPRW